jgi:hypothetical protein
MLEVKGEDHMSMISSILCVHGVELEPGAGNIHKSTNNRQSFPSLVVSFSRIDVIH